MKATLHHLLAQLNHGLVDREDVLKSALLSVLARENLVLIGPPGTGKSMIARRLAAVLDAAGAGEPGHFEYLLTKFSTPEEIFGPLSISALKEDRFSRNTAGYLPTVKIAFLDEIFKASSSILNALLTILNERRYHNGAHAQDVPLRSLIAASNELPADQDELGALYDRFLVRRFVDYVSPDKLAQLFEEPDAAPLPATLDAEALANIDALAKAVTIPPHVISAVQRIWKTHRETFKEDRRESLSDRRLKKVIGLMKVSAATNDRREVDLSDVFLLKDCLWNHPDNAIWVRDLIVDALGAADAAGAHGGVKALFGDTFLDILGQHRGTTIRGLQGSGTASDPFIVASVQDLMRLERDDVGRQGYHFRQDADIDCSSFTTWMPIHFRGHYDGAGHTIRHAPEAHPDTVSFSVVFGESMDPFDLFKRIDAQSTVRNVMLDNLGLTEHAAHSRIERCSSMGAPLISGTASGCMISDCLVALDACWRHDGETFMGGVAHTLDAGSTVERCFVWGKVDCRYGDSRVHFHGIASQADDATITACAIGALDLNERAVTLKHPFATGGVKLKDNALLEAHTKWDYLDRNASKRIPDALFAQPYFDNAMHWDFETVWQWDAANSRPFLRMPASGSAGLPDRPLPSFFGASGTLAAQMHANIWV